MAFKAKVISDEVNSDINSNIELGIDNDIHRTQSKTMEEKRETALRKISRQQPAKAKQFNADSIIKNSSIDYSKWLNYKKVVLMKPIEQLEDDRILNIQMPYQLVQKLNSLGWWNKSIHTKTIVCNLVIDFLERNKDIIDLLDNKDGR